MSRVASSSNERFASPQRPSLLPQLGSPSRLSHNNNTNTNNNNSHNNTNVSSSMNRRSAGTRIVSSPNNGMQRAAHSPLAVYNGGNGNGMNAFPAGNGHGHSNHHNTKDGARAALSPHALVFSSPSPPVPTSLQISTSSSSNASSATPSPSNINHHTPTATTTTTNGTIPPRSPRQGGHRMGRSRKSNASAAPSSTNGASSSSLSVTATNPSRSPQSRTSTTNSGNSNGTRASSNPRAPPSSHQSRTSALSPARPTPNNGNSSVSNNGHHSTGMPPLHHGASSQSHSNNHTNNGGNRGHLPSLTSYGSHHHQHTPSVSSTASSNNMNGVMGHYSLPPSPSPSDFGDKPSLSNIVPSMNGAAVTEQSKSPTTMPSIVPSPASKVRISPSSSSATSSSLHNHEEKKEEPLPIHMLPSSSLSPSSAAAVALAMPPSPLLSSSHVTPRLETVEEKSSADDTSSHHGHKSRPKDDDTTSVVDPDHGRAPVTVTTTAATGVVPTIRASSLNRSNSNNRLGSATNGGVVSSPSLSPLHASHSLDTITKAATDRLVPSATTPHGTTLVHTNSGGSTVDSRKKKRQTLGSLKAVKQETDVRMGKVRLIESHRNSGLPMRPRSQSAIADGLPILKSGGNSPLISRTASGQSHGSMAILLTLHNLRSQGKMSSKTEQRIVALLADGQIEQAQALIATASGSSSPNDTTNAATTPSNGNGNDTHVRFAAAAINARNGDNGDREKKVPIPDSPGQRRTLGPSRSERRLRLSGHGVKVMSPVMSPSPRASAATNGLSGGGRAHLTGGNSGGNSSGKRGSGVNALGSPMHRPHSAGRHGGGHRGDVRRSQSVWTLPRTSPDSSDSDDDTNGALKAEKIALGMDEDDKELWALSHSLLLLERIRLEQSLAPDLHTHLLTAIEYLESAKNLCHMRTTRIRRRLSRRMFDFDAQDTHNVVAWLSREYLDRDDGNGSSGGGRHGNGSGTRKRPPQIITGGKRSSISMPSSPKSLGALAKAGAALATAAALAAAVAAGEVPEEEPVSPLSLTSANATNTTNANNNNTTTVINTDGDDECLVSLPSINTSDSASVVTTGAPATTTTATTTETKSPVAATTAAVSPLAPAAILSSSLPQGASFTSSTTSATTSTLPSSSSHRLGTPKVSANGAPLPSTPVSPSHGHHTHHHHQPSVTGTISASVSPATAQRRASLAPPSTPPAPASLTISPNAASVGSPNKPLSPLSALSQSFQSSTLPLSTSATSATYHKRDEHHHGHAAAMYLSIVPSSELSQLLSTCLTWDFDIFKLATLTNNRPLSVLGGHLLHITGLGAQFQLPIPQVLAFLSGIEDGYPSNPYHNSSHGADVLQNMAFFLQAKVVRDTLSPEDLLACLLAAAAHDYGHPGVGNGFLITTSHPLALRYNDQSVLEHHHLAETFRLLQHPECNILAKLSRSQWQEVRTTMVGMVLATDMQKHLTLVSQFEELLHTKRNRNAGFDSRSKEDRRLLCNMALHCADLGNPAKPRIIAQQWLERVTVEFYQQGDKERSMGLPISPMMDRNKPQIELQQYAFIDFVIKPMLTVWGSVVENEILQPCLTHLIDNQKYFANRIEEMGGVNPMKASPPPAPAQPLPSGSSNATSSGSVIASSSSASLGHMHHEKTLHGHGHSHGHAGSSSNHGSGGGASLPTTTNKDKDKESDVASTALRAHTLAHHASSHGAATTSTVVKPERITAITSKPASRSNSLSHGHSQPPGVVPSQFANHVVSPSSHHRDSISSTSSATAAAAAAAAAAHMSHGNHGRSNSQSRSPSIHSTTGGATAAAAAAATLHSPTAAATAATSSLSPHNSNGASGNTSVGVSPMSSSRRVSVPNALLATSVTPTAALSS